MNTIFWHDYETSGTSPAMDRPLQFAGIRTDEALNLVGEPLTLYCKPPTDILPHPDACLITGITPQTALKKGLIEPEFIAEINKQFMVPGTCGAGYNSLRFDDEVTRYTLYRNFFDPYEREWQGGNSRWDIIDMLRLTHALRPEGINWPANEEGITSFRLELLTEANHISHEAAHDALSDVYATIAMAKLVKTRQPRLYDYVYGHRQKHAVAPLINLRERKPFLHVSSRLPRESAYTALMIPLCAHPTNKNAILAFNLSSDPEGLLTLDPEQIRERIFTPAAELPEGAERIAIKAVHINRCPVVATPKLLDAKAAQRLGIDREVCERNWHSLKNADLAEKLARVFSGNSFAQPADPEAALYGGFPSHADKALLARVRNAEPGELPQLQAAFSDKRYRELLFRYRARYAPETLSDEEAAVWEEQRYQMLTDPDSGHLCLDSYFARLDELSADDSLPPQKRGIIDELRAWGDLILS